ncbi:thermonuclease family protein [Azospirillum brasilense]|uniref:thermonuclease family protein n=1 Tax=Azospirillum brasilense TaxID=192 RepID=UPI0011A86B5F|nr:thermonuclease family protein [Azospirillum brasilense]
MAIAFPYFPILLAVGAAAIFAPASAASDDLLTGRTQIIDAGTLLVATTQIRLYGIDAPGADQACNEHGRVWKCGKAAHAALESYIGSKDVVCFIEATNTDKEIFASCFAEGKDVAAWLVSEGWAITNKKASPRYSSTEAEAKSAKRGLWRSKFDNLGFSRSAGKTS